MNAFKLKKQSEIYDYMFSKDSQIIYDEPTHLLSQRYDDISILKKNNFYYYNLDRNFTELRG